MSVILKPASSHTVLIASVKRTGQKYIAAVQEAATQAIGHFLVHGNTTFASRLLTECFGEGSVGARTFVAFMETYGGMEFVGGKSKKFIKHAEKFDELPHDNLEEVQEYMVVLMATPWNTVRPDNPVSMYDVEESIKKLVKTAQGKIDKGEKVMHPELLRVINTAIASYHAAAFEQQEQPTKKAAKK